MAGVVIVVRATDVGKYPTSTLWVLVQLSWTALCWLLLDGELCETVELLSTSFAQIPSLMAWRGSMIICGRHVDTLIYYSWPEHPAFLN